MRPVMPFVILGLACVALIGASPDAAHAGGRNLNGRMAPDMQFADGGFNGITAKTRISAYRGRPVLVKFWLRDCPVCRRTLPRLQTLHDRWSKRGLVVVSVIHKLRPADTQPMMRKLGYDFPVACDVDGSQARKYGIGRRPADYLIGVDGRVQESNKVTDEAISQELGKYRLKQVDPLPAALRGARDAVWQGRMGTALKLSEAGARPADASEDLKAAAKRVLTLARQYLDGGAAWAERLAARKKVSEARGEFARLRQAFAGTSLAKQASALEADFTRRYGKP